MKKSEEKFKLFSGVHRGINLTKLMKKIVNVSQMYDSIDDTKDFDWSIVPNLEK